MLKKILTYDRLASKPYPFYALLLALPATSICYILYDYLTLTRVDIGSTLFIAFIASLWASICFFLARIDLKWIKIDLIYILASYILYFSAIIASPLHGALRGDRFSLTDKTIASDGSVILGEKILIFGDGIITLAGWLEYSKAALIFFLPLVVFLYLFSYILSAKSSKLRNIS